MEAGFVCGYGSVAIMAPDTCYLSNLRFFISFYLLDANHGMGSFLVKT